MDLNRLLLRFINLYPPFIGAGIRSREIDPLTQHVEMKLTGLNRNVYGSHFGGSLYAMCDPWFALILLRALGPGYIVWVKAASIQFLRPGHGKVSAIFHIPPARIEEIREVVESGEKAEPVFAVDVLDERGQTVAHVEKVLHVRRKKPQIL